MVMNIYIYLFCVCVCVCVLLHLSIFYRLTNSFLSASWSLVCSESKPLMEGSEREGEGEGCAEPTGKHSKWCHLVMSKPRASRLTIPTLRDFLAICFAHFLQDDRSDLAYSAMILIWYWEEEVEEAIADFFMEAHFGGVCLCRLPQVVSRYQYQYHMRLPSPMVKQSCYYWPCGFFWKTTLKAILFC